MKIPSSLSLTARFHHLLPGAQALLAVLAVSVAGPSCEGSASQAGDSPHAELPTRETPRRDEGTSPRAPSNDPSGPGVSVDIVNVYAGAAEITVQTATGADRVLPWLGAGDVVIPESGTTVSAAGTSVPVSSGAPSQLVVYGQGDSGLGVVALPPAPTSVAQLRVLNASEHLGVGVLYTTGSMISDSTQLALGELSPWRILATDPISLASPLRLMGRLSDRSFELTLEHPITKPTTLIVATNAEREVVLVGLADDGDVFVQGPVPAPAELRFAHFATLADPVTWTLDGAPLKGIDAVGPHATTEYTRIAPGPQRVVTAWRGAEALASTTVDVGKFDQWAFTLVGGPGALSIVSSREGEAERPWRSGERVRLNVVDGRAPTAPPAALYTKRVDTLDEASEWEPMLQATTPSGLVTVEVDGTHHLLVGADLDGDGALDSRFDVGGWNGAELIDLRLAVDEAGRPWMGVQWNGASSYAVPALERTAWLRVWNVDRPDALMVDPGDARPVFGSWITPVYTGSVSGTAMLPDGAYTMSTNEQPQPVTAAGLTDVTLLALADGTTLSVHTEHPVAESRTSAVVVNLSAWAVTASVVGGPALGTIAPHSVGAETPVSLSAGGLLQLNGSSGETLSFALPASNYGGASVYALTGDDAWPTLWALNPSGYGPVALHPTESSAALRVYAVFAGPGAAQLAIDGQVLSGVQVRTWGKSVVAAGGSGSVVAPAGSHTLTLTRDNGEVITSAVDLPAGATTEFMVFPNGAVQVLPPLDDGATASVRVINASTSATASDVFLESSAGVDTLWVQGLLPREVRVALLGDGPGLASVDYDLDGTPDWKQFCGLSGGSTLVVVGSGESQAIAQFYGGEGYAVMAGKPL